MPLTKNPVSAAVSSYEEKTFYEPQPQRVDPLSYDDVKNVIARWVSQYCKRKVAILEKGG